MCSDVDPADAVKKAAWKVVTGALVLVFRDIRKIRVVASSAYTLTSNPIKANSLYFYAICRECVLLNKIMEKPLREYDTVRTAMVGFVLDHFVPKHELARGACDEARGRRGGEQDASGEGEGRGDDPHELRAASEEAGAEIG